MNKTICLFSAHYLPNLGGVERYTYNLAKNLSLKGNRVIIVTSNTSDYPAYEIQENIEIFRLPCYNLLNGRFPVLKTNYNFRRIIKALEAITMDLVIVNTRYYTLSLYGTKIAKKKKVKCIIIDHSTGHLSIGNKFFDFWGEVFEHFQTSLLKRNCHSFYGVSHACVDWLKHFNIECKGILYNAIDIDNIQQIAKKRMVDYRCQYNVESNEFVVTYAGRLVKEKGALNLIEAVKKINLNKTKIHLFIAGSGDIENEVIDSIKDELEIHYLGQLKFENIIMLLNQSDIFCLPTAYPEGFPTSVLEAAACHCYVITTEKGGSKELIVDSSYGRIMSSNSIEDIIISLQSAIEKEDINLAVEKTYKVLKENFVWDKISEKVEALVE